MTPLRRCNVTLLLLLLFMMMMMMMMAMHEFRCCSHRTAASDHVAYRLVK